jgi:hypothetical protein
LFSYAPPGAETANIYHIYILLPAGNDADKIADKILNSIQIIPPLPEMPDLLKINGYQAMC